jgi:hypothetical protein
VTISNNSSIVWERQLEDFNSWFQFVTWNGRDASDRPLPEGIYTVLIEIWPLQETTQIIYAQLEIEIDYSNNIFPMSFDSGVSGLTFTPMPHTLPAGSYQLEAGLLYGRFYMASQGDEYEGLPFTLNMRIAPFQRLELTTAFNINPFINNQTGWGVTGSAKFNFLNGSSSLPLAFAAAVSYVWSTDAGQYLLGPGRGAGLHIPLSLELINLNIGHLSIIICPSLFWHGPAGLVPELLLCAGILYRAGWLNAGLSMRYEFNFSDNVSPRFLAGAEIKLFPPPSNLVYSLRAGLMKQDQYTGGFGGLSIGVIY